jgi:hypothetical protein
MHEWYMKAYKILIGNISERNCLEYVVVGGCYCTSSGKGQLKFNGE